MLRLQRAWLGHVGLILPTLRPEDYQEIASASGKHPGAILAQGVGMGKSWAALDEEDNPVLLFGVAPGGVGIGIPWLVASTGIVRHGRQIARLTRPLVDAMNEGYPVLRNFADCRNTLHLRWLRWAGFTFLQTSTDFAADGSPFVEFIRIRNHV